ncbi:PID-CTERM protein-sorting domain-containing protein [Flavivirga jejuensis]|uniref:XrtJ-associated TM-motif-TM protein n=1 Tax=Flavivirga jejuensis TaxID=870487 RepID=A0ABT8WQT6_9FLAO|nr:hypothetical protein [Flavivirga jejuensis]MDO5975538.1 hypothetical protein [Flavivirga jejuensis]
MKVQNKRILASVLFVLISLVCFAQDLPAPAPPGPPPVPPGLPIDGGVLFGVVFAMFYGVRKLLTKNNH